MAASPELIGLDGLTLLEHRVSGVVVRVSDTARYALSAPEPEDAEPVEVMLDQGLLWAATDAATGGAALNVHHDAATLSMTSGRVLVDAGPVGDSLVVVVAGEVEVQVPDAVDHLLLANEAAALRPTGAVAEVTPVTSAEVAADPWANVNLRLDEQTVSAASGSGTPEPEQPPATEAEALHRAKRRSTVIIVAALALGLVAAAVAVAVQIDHTGGSPDGPLSSRRESSGDNGRAAPRSADDRSTSTAARTSTTTTLTVRPAPSELKGCSQERAGTLVVSGTASDPSGRVRRYRVQVALASETGARLTTATSVVAARPDGAPTPWTISVPVGNLAGRNAACQLLSVDALSS